MKVRWFFDPISPYAYLHLQQFGRLPPTLEIECVPILFAGLLKHWGHKGPAEIAPKRAYTYQQVVWLARQLGIALRLPPRHPFNPLPLLRLLTAAGPTLAQVVSAFDLIWREGCDAEAPETLTEFACRLGIDNPAAVLTDERVKRKLHDNTAAAIAAGVFGVPTFAIGDRLFWGQDSLSMMLDYLRDPGLFDSDEMRRAATMPSGTARRQAGPPA
ncbi:MAG: 2-hydroxychromene-2-carboxylate isomerase [Stenotrophobium sp.]